MLAAEWAGFREALPLPLRDLQIGRRHTVSTDAFSTAMTDAQQVQPPQLAERWAAGLPLGLGIAFDSPPSGDTFDRLSRKQPQLTATCLDLCLLYTSPSPRDAHESRMPSSA